MPEFQQKSRLRRDYQIQLGWK